MKKKQFLTGILALALVFGTTFTALSLTGCDDGSRDITGTVTVTLPDLTGMVVISNTSPEVGDILTAAYTEGNGTGTAVWQWLADDVVIFGAAGSAYEVAGGNVGKALKAQVSYPGQTGSVTSEATGTVRQASPNKWSEWTDIDLADTQERVSLADPSRIEHRYTGTKRFTASPISGEAAYSLLGGTDKIGTVRIPTYYRPSAESGYQPVTEIGADAFNGCTSLTGIIIHDSITAIGEGAFASCEGLISITVAATNPNYTGEGGILYNKDKTEYLAYPSASGDVTIPDNVTFIGGAFSGCRGLTGITIPEGVTSIGDYAFYNCTSLTGVTIPDNVTSIGSGAFYNCTGLTGSIPAGVTSIGDNAFYNCSGLTGGIPAGVTSIGSGAFYNCTGLTGLTGSIGIPAGVTSIGNSTFYGCSGLTTVSIPASVTSIGANAFYNCTNLLSVYFAAGNVSIGNDAFPGGNNLMEAYDYRYTSNGGAGWYSRNANFFTWTKQ